jgi:hypothetical protein
MSFGVAIDGFAYTYGTFSVVATGIVTTGSQTFVSKSAHPDLSDLKVVFIPIGVRSPGDEEVRPVLIENSYALYANSPSDLSPHRYIVLGR